MAGGWLPVRSECQEREGTQVRRRAKGAITLLLLPAQAPQSRLAWPATHHRHLWPAGAARRLDRDLRRLGRAAAAARGRRRCCCRRRRCRCRRRCRLCRWPIAKRLPTVVCVAIGCRRGSRRRLRCRRCCSRLLRLHRRLHINERCPATLCRRCCCPRWRGLPGRRCRRRCHGRAGPKGVPGGRRCCARHCARWRRLGRLGGRDVQQVQGGGCRGDGGADRRRHCGAARGCGRAAAGGRSGGQVSGHAAHLAWLCLRRAQAAVSQYGTLLLRLAVLPTP